MTRVRKAFRLVVAATIGAAIALGLYGFLRPGYTGSLPGWVFVVALVALAAFAKPAAAWAVRKARDR